ncbi:hypothetical protein ACB092_10G024800 [Castanea dentata]
MCHKGEGLQGKIYWWAFMKQCAYVQFASTPTKED